MTTFLQAKWENIIMANYVVDANLLAPFLPKGVVLDLYSDTAYVSLVGFMFSNTRLFHVPIPWLGTFEEVNLRFYVVRKDGDTPKRGVVFINETVPYKPVAWLANKLYKEHYTAVDTRHTWQMTGDSKQIEYQWLVDKQWNSISVEASIANNPMLSGSFEAFIFEHYYGYTKINEASTDEYRINHPSWNVNTVHNYHINCQFAQMYGKAFAFLDSAKPHSVFIAEGSPITVEWQRNRISL
jgi:uncharacterized protein